MTLKQCSHCGGLKHVRYFSRDRTRRDGLCGRCKACESERQRALYRRRRYGNATRVATKYGSPTHPSGLSSPKSRPLGRIHDVADSARAATELDACDLVLI